MRSLQWAALAAATLMLVPATTLAFPAALAAEDLAGPALPPAFAGAVGAQNALAAYADGFQPGGRPGDMFARAATLQADARGAEAPAMTFDEALAALYAAAGLPAPAADAAPPAPLAEALAPLVGATAAAALLTQDAFAALTAEEKDFLWANFELAFAPTAERAAADATAGDVARLEAIVAKVHVPSIMVGGSMLSQAMAAFEAPGGPSAQAWTDPYGLIVVGGGSDDAYCGGSEPVLIVELGGNDRYCGHPAAYGPFSPGPIPVRAILEVGGNDRYETLTAYPGHPEVTWGQGVGIGGIGILMDRWGDDTYTAQITNTNTGCDRDWYTGLRQVMYAQGVGALGAGAVFDLGGNDAYTARNVNTVDSYCHFGWAYTFAQASGLMGGLGLLVDYTGDDSYDAYARSAGRYDNIAHTHAQAAAAGGIAVLADDEGHDSYTADAYAHLGNNLGLIKGNFAYVFAQASVFATRLNPGSLPSTGVNTPYVPWTCTTVPVLGYQACIGGGASGLSGCRASAPFYAYGGNDSCDAPGAAILVDVLGNDRFSVAPVASDRGYGCTAGDWAVSSAQGSAAWTGLAALLNFDLGTSDTFSAAPDAHGMGCSWLGTRALSYGQGYGGPILWNYWDVPWLTSEHVAIGIAASGGVTRTPCTVQAGVPAVQPGTPGTPGTPGIALPGIRLPTGHTVEPGYLDLGRIAADNGATDVLQALTGRAVKVPTLDGSPLPETAVCRGLSLPGDDVTQAPDRWSSTPRATNPGWYYCGWATCLAVAESWVQGSAGREVTLLNWGQGGYATVRELGIGLAIDVGGDDLFHACPAAIAAKAADAQARAVVQGAAVGGIGALVNVGGHDKYTACVLENGASKPNKVVAQGAGAGSIGMPAQQFTPLPPVSSPPVNVAGIGILGSQQLWPPSVSVSGSTTTTPGLSVGGTGVPPQQVSTPGASASPQPITTPPVSVAGFSVPATTVNPASTIGTPAVNGAPAIGILIDLSGTDFYSEAARWGCLHNGPTFGTPLWLGFLGTVWWGNVVPGACPTGFGGMSIHLDWISDVGL